MENKKQSAKLHKSPLSKKPSVQMVWVKSVKNSPSIPSSPALDSAAKGIAVTTEDIRNSKGKQPVIEQMTTLSIEGSEEDQQLVKEFLLDSVDRSRNVKFVGSCSSSRSVRSVWVERAKIAKPDSHDKTDHRMETPVAEGPPSSSSPESGEDGKESKEKPKRKQKGSKLPAYQVPKHLMDLIEMDKVPDVLTMPLTLATYADYFAALLYAEDFYIEKWSDFLLYRVTLDVDEKQMKKERKKKNVIDSAQKNNKIYLSFEITSIPMRRPYLLSRDFVFVRRSGKKSKHFEGRLTRVIKSTRVLAEFGDDFSSQYSPLHKYDVSFSFNRTCLKRSHQAVQAALHPSFHNIIFPLVTPGHDPGHEQASVIPKILSLRGRPPYLIKGPLAVTKQKCLSSVGTIILEAILQIYQNFPRCRILVTAPRNLTCDTLIKRLNEFVPDSELFRANATFREIEDVPDDILPLCSYDGECFFDHSLSDLKEFKVIVSTSMTCFRLHSSGIAAGHFTHIFMVDASSATEPENMVALANLVGEDTSIVITGAVRNHPERVRSDIARRHGLKRSYFHRLLEIEPYLNDNPEFVSCIG